MQLKVPGQNFMAKTLSPLFIPAESAWPGLYLNLGANSTVGPNTWSGTVTEKITGNQDVLTGTLTRTTPGNVQTMWKVSITLDLKNDKIISTFTQVGVKNAKPFGDMGTYSLKTAGANFNGNLNVEVATVPEPAGIVLSATALLGGLGCWCRRRRKDRPNEGD